MVAVCINNNSLFLPFLPFHIWPLLYVLCPSCTAGLLYICPSATCRVCLGSPDATTIKRTGASI